MQSEYRKRNGNSGMANWSVDRRLHYKDQKNLLRINGIDIRGRGMAHAKWIIMNGIPT